ncbi:MAG: lysophospholipid acyltransferase family protein [Flavihumibacter sp.]
MYYPVYGLLYAVSLLPMWILYTLGDIAGGLLFGFFGYRRQVVMDNLARAFPEKSPGELNLIRKRFQRNFTDTFIETVKYLSASETYLRKHVQGNFELFDSLYQRGLSCQVHMGHNFNWELLNLSYGIYSKRLPLLGVYMPLENPVMDRIFRKLRSRTGTILLPATEMRQAFFPYRNQQYLLGLIADQVPGNISAAFWLYFFNIPTPFIPGPEKGARAGNIPVVFVHTTRIKRGHYRMNATLVTETPQTLAPGELTRLYRDFLEKVMVQHPDMWLWSHRRWKHAWNSSYASQWIDNTPMPASAPR